MARSKIAARPTSVATLVLVLSVALAGCTAPKEVAPDLLGSNNPNAVPMTSSGYETTVTINPRISNYEHIDDAVHESLDMALNSAHIFSPTGASKYKIKADILTASESTVSFGSFDNTLQIHYAVVAPSGQQVFDQTISTEAGTDHWTFLGAERHRRARAVNIAKNVQEFVSLLRADKDLK